jgi:hypothetical protein
MRAPAFPDNCVITLSVADVNMILKQVNIKKARRGPDGGQTGARRVTRTCTQTMCGPTGMCLH